MKNVTSTLWAVAVLTVFGFVAVSWIEHKIAQFNNAVSNAINAPFEAASEGLEDVRKWTSETNDSINGYLEQSEEGRALNQAVSDFADAVFGK